MPSPPSVFSTFTTSAPRSASSIPQNGTVTIWPNSSTLRPARGRKDSTDISAPTESNIFRWSSGRWPGSPLDRQVALLRFLVVHQRLGRAFVDHQAVAEQVDAVRQRQAGLDVLLDDHDRLAFLRQPADDFHQCAHDDRCQPLEWFVEHQQ
eukprot:Opistho-2@39625